MQSGFAVGYALAALVAAVALPRWGWRAVFFAGILPALLTLWIRRGGLRNRLCGMATIAATIPNRRRRKNLC